MPQLNKISLSDQVYQILRKRIITAAVPMGGSLNISELKSEFGTSSTPIREALNRLQGEGLVVYSNNVGAKVIRLDRQDIHNIHDVTMVLHSAAIRFAMERGDHQAIADDIQRHISSYREASSIDDLIESVHGLINVFYDHCGNPKLKETMRVVEGPQLMIRYLFHQYMGADYSNVKEHQEVYEAVLAGDTERIVANYIHNIQRADEIICGLLESSIQLS